jgi:hypothetical protein
MSEACSEIYSEDSTTRGALAQQAAPPLMPLEETLTKAVSNALYLQHAINNYAKIAPEYLERAAKITDTDLKRRNENRLLISIRALYNPMRYSKRTSSTCSFVRRPRIRWFRWRDASLLGEARQPIRRRHREARTGPPAQAPTQSAASGQAAPPWPPDAEYLAKFATNLGPTNVKKVQDGLQAYIADLRNLMSARQEKPSDKFVADVRALATPGYGQSYKWSDVANPECERWMLARIRGASAPLFVQLGDEHRSHLAATQLPADVVPVARCEPVCAGGTTNDDFVKLATKLIMSTNWLAWGLAAAAAVAVIGAAAGSCEGRAGERPLDTALARRVGVPGTCASPPLLLNPPPERGRSAHSCAPGGGSPPHACCRRLQQFFQTSHRRSRRGCGRGATPPNITLKHVTAKWTPVRR